MDSNLLEMYLKVWCCLGCIAALILMFLVFSLGLICGASCYYR